MNPDERKRRKHALAATTPADVDLSVLSLCRLFGHRIEGHVVDLEDPDVARLELYLIGRCQQCGLGIMTDGS